MDPLRASGLIAMDGSVTKGAPDFSDAIREGIKDTYTIVTFLVAHELYHLDHPFTCSGSVDECNRRLREHEVEADGFGIEVLAKQATQDPTPDHRLGVPAYVFSQLMLTMEGAREPLVPVNHPPSHERMRSAADALEKWINANPVSPSAESLREFVKMARGILSAIDKEGPAGYFAGVDEEASEVTLASLKIY